MIVTRFSILIKIESNGHEKDDNDYGWDTEEEGRKDFLAIESFINVKICVNNSCDNIDNQIMMMMMKMLIIMVVIRMFICYWWGREGEQV